MIIYCIILFVIIFRVTYLPVWKKLIDEKAIVGIMSGISAVNGIPSAANKYLLNDVLRNEWNFTGYVISKVIFVFNELHFSLFP
jgi:beta-glucosidase-like glycosyl hydrolase